MTCDPAPAEGRVVLRTHVSSSELYRAASMAVRLFSTALKAILLVPILDSRRNPVVMTRRGPGR